MKLNEIRWWVGLRTAQWRRSLRRLCLFFACLWLDCRRVVFRLLANGLATSCSFSRSSIPFYLTAAAVLWVGYWPRLPAIGYSGLLLALELLLLWRRNYGLAAVVGGLLWTIFSGQQLLALQLPESLEGRDIRVSGCVSDLPVDNPRRQRFEFRVDRALDQGKLLEDFPRHILLSHYAGFNRDKVSADSSNANKKRPQGFKSGECWQLWVRLKRPRGFVNFGGFDYQAWLLRQGIGATGYIRVNEAPKRLASDRGFSITPLRQRFSDWLQLHIDAEYLGLAQGLLIGERSQISRNQWQLLRRTGTNHLLAISGLHIGLVALLGHSLGLLLGRLLNLLPLGPAKCACQRYASVVSVLAALVYAALAGFSLPTQRALIMVLLIQLGYSCYRSLGPARLLGITLLAVVLLDPLAALDIGFWLSFGAVACLMLAFSGRLQPRRGWRAFVRAQWVLLLGLSVASLWLLQGLAWLAPLANAFALPLVTFLLVPLLLLAAIVSLLPWVWSTHLSEWLLVWVERGLALLVEGLSLLSNGLAARIGDLLWHPPAPIGVGALLLGIAAVMLLLMPRGLPGRWLGCPLLCAALWPGGWLKPGGAGDDLRLTVFDVGQGLAVLVELPGYRLLYDTGPRYSDKFEAGGAILLPYLWRRGVSTLDRVIVSHGDNDHAGGWQGLSEGMAVDSLRAGQMAKFTAKLKSAEMHRRAKITELAVDGRPTEPDMPPSFRACVDGERWRVGRVSFETLQSHHVQSHRVKAGKANNQSCILLLGYHRAEGVQWILLPGDIEASVERQLVAGGRLPSSLHWLLAPHHGSKTSSSGTFVDYTRPKYVVYSASYRSRYGHPHPDVVARYQQLGSQAFSTAEQGALQWRWRGEEQLLVEVARVSERRYWFAD